MWDADLEQEVRTELEDFRGHAVEENAGLVPMIDSALAELGGPARQNHVAHALIWRAATKLVRRASRNHELMPITWAICGSVSLDNYCSESQPDYCPG